MEEILASIKRVISEDGRPVPVSRPRGASSKAPAEPESSPPPPAVEPEVDAEEDVLELSEPMKADDGLTSQNVTAAARQSLLALAAVRQPKHFEPQHHHPGDGPLEAVVRDMLRPMLKEWLDTRLPEMVEEMVAREIARITGKRI